MGQGAVAVDEDEAGAILERDKEAVTGIILLQNVQVDADAVSGSQLFEVFIAGHT